jgi:hypothetical protein
MSMVAPPGDSEIPLYRLLDTIAGTGREWVADGDTVRLRSLTWAHDRRGEIPVRYMRRWLVVRDKKGAFNLDDLAEIATLLRDEQVESLMFSAIEAGSNDITDFIMVSANREPLRLWGKLLPAQRRALAAGTPVPVRSLFPYQQARVLNLYASRGNQSMFAIAMGTKPQRSPAQLAEGRITLQHRENPRVNVGVGVGPGAAAVGQARASQAPPAGQPAPGGADGGIRPGGQVMPGINAPNAVYLLRIEFPDGQKDDYAIPVTSRKAQGP